MASTFKLRWPVDSHTIIQHFGENPRIYAKFNLPGHEGLDFRAPEGAPISACADGRVTQVRPNDGNPYGLHVRIRHRVGGREYHTVYAHLSHASVSEEEPVSAGQRIGLAGNTGHSYGPHLHLTLKMLGARTPGYPEGVIDPLPYLREEAEAEVPAPSDLVVYATAGVRLRAGPTISSAQLAWLEAGEALTVLGDGGAARAWVGQYGEWIRVRRGDGTDGFVAAWYVQLEPPEAGALTVWATEDVRLRAGPSTASAELGWIERGEALRVTGDAGAARAKAGQGDAWLPVARADGTDGYVAAWYVQLAPLEPELPVLVPPVEAEGRLVVYATEALNVRLNPSAESSRIAIALPHEPLAALGDRLAAADRLGDRGAWLRARLPEPTPEAATSGPVGYVAAWYVQMAPGPPPEVWLTVYPTEDVYFRERPTVRSNVIGTLAQNTPLRVHDDAGRAIALVGWYDHWLYVETPEGQRGWVAAWYVAAEEV